MNDLISRQAAIDAVYNHLPYVSRERARIILRDVPSAQPEIIWCKDCKYSEEDEDEHGIVDRWCRIWAETCTDDGYCNYAERRTDG